MNVRSFDCANAQDLAPYSTMRRSLFHLQNGIFIAEGLKTVSRLLSSAVSVTSMLMTQEYINALKPALMQESHIPLWLASKAQIEQLTQLQMSQPVLAAGKIPRTGSIEEFLTKRNISFLIVALDAVNHAVNVGSIVRNCAAFGVDGILISDPLSHPYLRRAIRTSLGAVFSVPVFETPDLAAALRNTQASFRAKIIAGDPSGNCALDAADLSGNVCIVFGNEQEGISQAVRELQPQQVFVRTEQSVDSLNVASASAVILHAAATQRR